MFTATGPKVVKPVTAERWEKVLSLYERLGTALGSQLFVVAPDMLGNQDVTLERLARYDDRVNPLANLGVPTYAPLRSRLGFVARNRAR